MNRPANALTGLLAVATLTLGFAVSANADEPAVDPGSALSDVTSDSSSPATDVLSDVAKVATDAVGETAIDAKVAGIDVTVPTDPSDPISLESSSGKSIAIELPFADVAADATVVTQGVVAYDNNNASSTAPVVKDDGSLQVTTVIESAEAPTDYPYKLSIPAGAVTSLNSDGSVAIVNADGTFLAGVSPAWAKDADGTAVPTYYVLDGGTLTQVVEHTSATFAYPIVADPWLGLALIDHTTWTTRSSQGPTLQVYPTTWGRALGLNSFYWPFEWVDVLSKTPANRAKVNTGDMMNQYYCHLALGANIWKDSYNLDTYIHRGSLWNYIVNRCN